jgi:hypothetical protein
VEGNLGDKHLRIDDSALTQMLVLQGHAGRQRGADLFASGADRAQPPSTTAAFDLITLDFANERSEDRGGAFAVSNDAQTSIGAKDRCRETPPPA